MGEKSANNQPGTKDKMFSYRKVTTKTGQCDAAVNCTMFTGCNLQGPAEHREMGSSKDPVLPHQTS